MIKLKRTNVDIRAEIASRGLMLKEVAEEMGIRPTSLSRMLSRENLREGTKHEIRLAIGKAAEKKSEG